MLTKINEKYYSAQGYDGNADRFVNIKVLSGMHDERLFIKSLRRSNAEDLHKCFVKYEKENFEFLLHRKFYDNSIVYNIKIESTPEIEINGLYREMPCINEGMWFFNEFELGVIEGNYTEDYDNLRSRRALGRCLIKGMEKITYFDECILCGLIRHIFCLQTRERVAYSISQNRMSVENISKNLSEEIVTEP